MYPEGAGAPMPYHHRSPVKHVEVPTILLNLAVMSLSPGFKSKPARELARAFTYQVEARGAPVKSRNASVGPALPSVPKVGEQDRGSMVALTRIGTVDLRIAPQYSAAARKAFNL